MPDYSTYIAGWKERERAERQAVEARRQIALAEARKVAQFLGETFGVIRAVGIGSAFDAKRFTLRSDLDLVVEGLADRDYFSASAQIRFLTNFEVDLIPIESANHLLKQRVAEEGVQLWP